MMGTMGTMQDGELTGIVFHGHSTVFIRKSIIKGNK